MYFDPQPKTKKEDLFGLNFTLQQLVQHLQDQSTRLVIIKGLRRTGKTSLLNVALQESKLQYVKIDVRDAPFYQRQEFFRFLVERIREQLGESFWDKVVRAISGVELTYDRFSVSITLSREENFMLFFRALNQQLEKQKRQFLFALDEAQLLKEIKFDYILASIFDNYSQIKLVLTGSEVGLLDAFLGKEDYSAPLYGRAYAKVELPRMREEEVMQFLTLGFQQLNRKISLEEMKEVVGIFDGITGWATHYGWLRSKNNSHEQAINEVKEQGIKITRNELLSFLQKRKAKDKYGAVLQALARRNNAWGAIKNYLLQKSMKITHHQLTFYLQELQDYGFVEKTERGYFLSDPLLMGAVKGG